MQSTTTHPRLQKTQIAAVMDVVNAITEKKYLICQGIRC